MSFNSGICSGRRRVYLATEVWFFKAVPIHDFYQVFKHTVEHLVKLFSNHRQGLLGWQCGCVKLHL